MVDYKRILRLRAEGVSQRGVADALGCSRNTVAEVVQAAKALGLGWEEVADLDSGEVRHLLLPGPPEKVSGRVRPDFSKIHQELARPNTTLLLLWNEYAARCRAEDGAPYQYSFFCEQYRRWAQASGATMRIAREPGEALEVDWAGDAMEYADPTTGELRPAWLFVAALSFSAYSYVEAFADMTLASWVEAHVNAFAFFGGAARTLIPDNLRAGVARSDRYEPALNPAYAQLADHYDTVVMPARVRHPKDKPVVEGSVRFAANAVSATLRDRFFIGLGELNQAIADEVELINARPFQKREDSRLLVFLRDDKPALRPLPPVPFELAVLKKAKVGPNYHIQVEGCFYSVPSRLIGQTLDVRTTSRTVEAFAGLERVAVHPRLAGKGRYATVEEHMPRAHREQLRDWTPERFTRWAATIGPATVQVVEAVLASKKIVEQSFRPCLGIMSLAKKQGGSARLEQTCAHALSATPSPTYTLVKRLWARWEPQPAPPAASLGDKGFVRGASYYDQNQGEQR